MDERTRKLMESGVPMSICYFDKKGNVISTESYNSDKISPPDYELKQLAKRLCELTEKYFSDPANVKKFEEWKANKKDTSIK